MLEAALYLALGAALVSALAGGRTSIVLTVSVAICLGLGWAGVEFHRGYWIGLDIAVMAVIGGFSFSRRDWAIVLLFPVAWGFYLLPDGPRYYGSLVVTIAQLLLSYRHELVREAAAQWWERAKRTPLPRHDDIDLWKAAR